MSYYSNGPPDLKWVVLNGKKYINGPAKPTAGSANDNDWFNAKWQALQDS